MRESQVASSSGAGACCVPCGTASGTSRCVAGGCLPPGAALRVRPRPRTGLRGCDVHSWRDGLSALACGASAAQRPGRRGLATACSTSGGVHPLTSMARARQSVRMDGHNVECEGPSLALAPRWQEQKRSFARALVSPVSWAPVLSDVSCPRSATPEERRHVAGQANTNERPLGTHAFCKPRRVQHKDTAGLCDEMRTGVQPSGVQPAASGSGAWPRVG